LGAVTGVAAWVGLPPLDAATPDCVGIGGFFEVDARATANELDKLASLELDRLLSAGVTADWREGTAAAAATAAGPRLEEAMDGCLETAKEALWTADD
jgi:hypothetical protein